MTIFLVFITTLIPTPPSNSSFFAATLGKLFTPLYNLLLVKGRWSPEAGKATRAGSTGSFRPDLWLMSLTVCQLLLLQYLTDHWITLIFSHACKILTALRRIWPSSHFCWTSRRTCCAYLSSVSLKSIIDLLDMHHLLLGISFLIRFSSLFLVSRTLPFITHKPSFPIVTTFIIHSIGARLHRGNRDTGPALFEVLNQTYRFVQALFGIAHF